METDTQETNRKRDRLLVCVCGCVYICVYLCVCESVRCMFVGEIREQDPIKWIKIKGVHIFH